jgi:maltooligosyltrehalose trehalohydrolase
MSSSPVSAHSSNQAIEPSATFVGAWCDAHGVFYRVWAPERENVRVAYSTTSANRPEFALERDNDGYFSGRDPDARAGDLYMYRLDNQTLAPDPASRYQPAGVFGPSQVVKNTYKWEAKNWQHPLLRGRVIYELHLGTFSPEGTFRGAINYLDHVIRLGANTIEIMPVADFPGRWNWGYDGVMLYAPARCYGTPDDFRALVDAAHERQIAVVFTTISGPSATT